MQANIELTARELAARDIDPARFVRLPPMQQRLVAAGILAQRLAAMPGHPDAPQWRNALPLAQTNHPFVTVSVINNF